MSSTLVGTLIFPFLFLGPQTDQMGIDAQICFADEFAIESASANLSPAINRIAFRRGSNAKAMRLAVRSAEA